MLRSHQPAIAAAFILALSAASLMASPTLAAVPGSTSEVNTDANGIAMRGYDPVAYFTDGAPTKGDARFAASYEGARYLFATEANLMKFQADPAAYAPQFGGFCAMGASFGEKVDTDPQAWKIVDGKLYLNNSKPVQDRWLTDIPGNIQRANDQWPIIKDHAQ